MGNGIGDNIDQTSGAQFRPEPPPDNFTHAINKIEHKLTDLAQELQKEGELLGQVRSNKSFRRQSITEYYKSSRAESKLEGRIASLKKQVEALESTKSELGDLHKNFKVIAQYQSQPKALRNLVSTVTATNLGKVVKEINNFANSQMDIVSSKKSSKFHESIKDANQLMSTLVSKLSGSSARPAEIDQLAKSAAEHSKILAQQAENRSQMLDQLSTAKGELGALSNKERLFPESPKDNAKVVEILKKASEKLDKIEKEYGKKVASDENRRNFEKQVKSLIDDVKGKVGALETKMMEAEQAVAERKKELLKNLKFGGPLILLAKAISSNCTAMSTAVQKSIPEKFDGLDRSILEKYHGYIIKFIDLAGEANKLMKKEDYFKREGDFSPDKCSVAELEKWASELFTEMEKAGRIKGLFNDMHRNASRLQGALHFPKFQVKQL